MKGRERFGFYCAGGNLGEVMGVFLTEKHSPDASVGSIGRWHQASGVFSVSGVSEKSASNARIGRVPDTVGASGVADVSKCASGCFLPAQALDSRERPVIPRETYPLCVRVQCAPDASGATVSGERAC